MKREKLQKTKMYIKSNEATTNNENLKVHYLLVKFNWPCTTPHLLMIYFAIWFTQWPKLNFIDARPDIFEADRAPIHLACSAIVTDTEMFVMR